MVYRTKGDIEDEFSQIRARIPYARTKKALKFLERSARKIVKQSSGSLYNKEIKRYAVENYKRIMILIRERSRFVAQ